MQSDQPQIPTRAKRSASVEEKEQEQVVLKDTILKIEKSYEQDSEGKHKANVTINYNDVKALYDRAEGAEKQSVLDFGTNCTHQIIRLVLCRKTNTILKKANS